MLHRRRRSRSAHLPSAAPDASSRRSSPQNRRSPTASVGTPKTPSAIASSVTLRRASLTCGSSSAPSNSCASRPARRPASRTAARSARSAPSRNARRIAASAKGFSSPRRSPLAPLLRASSGAGSDRSAKAIARAISRSFVGHGSGQRIGPSPRAAALASQSAIPSARRSVSAHEPRPLALKRAPANTPRQRACGTNRSIRSAANQEYGDIAPKKNCGAGTGQSSRTRPPSTRAMWQIQPARRARGPCCGRQTPE
jgi:hypothetical protein